MSMEVLRSQKYRNKLSKGEVFKLQPIKYTENEVSTLGQKQDKHERNTVLGRVSNKIIQAHVANQVIKRFDDSLIMIKKLVEAVLTGTGFFFFCMVNKKSRYFDDLASFLIMHISHSKSFLSNLQSRSSSLTSFINVITYQLFLSVSFIS